MSRTDDWFRQAEKDLLHTEESRKFNHFEWSSLAAQQSAKKAIKSLFMELGADPWGHSLLGLLNKLPKDNQPSSDVFDAAKYLDKLYITTRYPNGFAAGAPEDFFTEKDAKESIANARKILEFCRGEISTIRQKTL